MHHIRRTCDPDREGDFWRNQMKRLIDLEQPSFELRDAMVSAFNGGYTSAGDTIAWPTGEVLDLNGGAHLKRYPDVLAHVMRLAESS